MYLSHDLIDEKVTLTFLPSDNTTFANVRGAGMFRVSFVVRRPSSSSILNVFKNSADSVRFSLISWDL